MRASGRIIMRVLNKQLRAAEAEQKTHRRRYGGKCLSSCETIQEISVLRRLLDDIKKASKKSWSREVSAMMKYRAAVRQAVADYMQSEGCSCCRDYEAHKIHEARLGQLLGVKPYADNSGFDFSVHRSKA